MTVKELDGALGSAYDYDTVSLYGLTITNQVEYSGCDNLGDYLVAQEGQAQRFHREFSIRTAAAE